MKIHDPVYGEWELSDPVALELIALPQFQRMYDVGQHGSYRFGLPHVTTTRAEHSLGVYFLVRKFGGSHQEQIAALLHDISHTVFSHVVDYAWGNAKTQTAQDDTHHLHLAQEPVKAVLERAGYDYRELAHLEAYPLLDISLPDLCCDRLDYILRDSMLYQELDREDALKILDHVVVHDGVLKIDDTDIGVELVRLTAHMTEQYWGPPYGCFMFHRTGQALKKALSLGIINANDLYTTDHVVWDKMKASGDAEIIAALADVEHIRSLKLCINPESYDVHLHAKFRAVNPMVVNKGAVQGRVLDFYPDLKQWVDAKRSQLDQGHYIQVVKD